MSSHLATSSVSSSPSISSNGDQPSLAVRPPDGPLPPPAMPPPHATLTHALKSLDGLEHSASLLTRPTYDSPYSRSISSTAPGSPRIPPVRQNSGSHTPRVRPHATTLNIPGMTRSRASPDGRIAERDVAAKLVIIMVGLPARGKSYITKKIQRYLSWQQHNSRIFNVGNRRRIAAGVTVKSESTNPPPQQTDVPTQAATILLNGVSAPNIDEPTQLDLNTTTAPPAPPAEKIDQSAKFFDPNNESASKLREQVALDTLDELLDYLLHQGGSVGILDATNSTVHRRSTLVKHIKDREPKLGILFIESICHDENVCILNKSLEKGSLFADSIFLKLLEANIRLKLSGPDYKDKDPVKSLEDFRQRVEAYESAYEPLGKYEEDHDMQYIQVRPPVNIPRHILLSCLLTYRR